jgi:hypothetical protein
VELRRLLSRVAVAVAAAVAVSAAQAQTIWYVDDDACPGPGSGTPGDPFCLVQDAIDAALDGDEIVVAPGTYGEALDLLGKPVHLHSSDGPAVTTIDAAGLSASVVRCVSGESPQTVLEGFTITGGTGTCCYEIGGADYLVGGGMFNLDSSPTVSDCVFVSNSAQIGGGMSNRGAAPIVTGCTFDSNTAVNTGGGMDNHLGSSPAVTGCLFTGNTAGWGGGMDNDEAGSPTLTACTFINNTAAAGGGVRCVDTDGATLTNCEFRSNWADEGGGLLNYRSSPTVTRCAFSRNGGFWGAGMANDTDSRPLVTNCTVFGNEAASGGGFFNLDGGDPTVTNCTVTANIATVSGGGMLNANSYPTVFNTILWDNPGGEIVDADGGSATASYSDVQGGYDGPGNIDADPQLVDPATEDLQLGGGSPCIEAGHNWAVAPLAATDLAGNPRFATDEAGFDQGCGAPCVVDMGAYEFQGQPCAVTWGDIDGDVVGVVDFLYILADWGGCEQACCLSDLDLDGGVGVTDFLLLLANWS